MQHHLPALDVLEDVDSLLVTHSVQRLVVHRQDFVTWNISYFRKLNTTTVYQANLLQLYHSAIHLSDGLASYSLVAGLAQEYGQERWLIFMESKTR